MNWVASLLLILYLNPPQAETFSSFSIRHLLCSETLSNLTSHATEVEFCTFLPNKNSWKLKIKSCCAIYWAETRYRDLI